MRFCAKRYSCLCTPSDGRRSSVHVGTTVAVGGSRGCHVILSAACHPPGAALAHHAQQHGVRQCAFLVYLRVVGMLCIESTISVNRSNALNIRDIHLESKVTFRIYYQTSCVRFTMGQICFRGGSGRPQPKHKSVGGRALEDQRTRGTGTALHALVRHVEKVLEGKSDQTVICNIVHSGYTYSCCIYCTNEGIKQAVVRSLNCRNRVLARTATTKLSSRVFATGY